MRRATRIAVVAVLAVSSGALAVLALRADDGGRATGGGAPVVKLFTPDSTALASCSAGAELSRCQYQSLGNIAYSEGARAAFAAVKIARSNRTISGECHQIAHAIGHAVLARHDGDTAQALAEGAPDCASGFYHGVFEAGFRRVPSARIGAYLRDTCPAGMKRPLRKHCLHGLGHGAVIYERYRLDDGLELCDRLYTPDRRPCYIGAVMENVHGTARDTSSLWFRPNDASWPCRALNARYRPDCYFAVTAPLVRERGDAWAGMARSCVAFRATEQAECHYAVGVHAGWKSRLAPSVLPAACDVAGVSLRRACLSGALWVMSVSAHPRQHSAALCARVQAVDRASCEAMATA